MTTYPLKLCGGVIRIGRQLWLLTLNTQFVLHHPIIKRNNKVGGLLIYMHHSASLMLCQTQRILDWHCSQHTCNLSRNCLLSWRNCETWFCSNNSVCGLFSTTSGFLTGTERQCWSSTSVFYNYCLALWSLTVLLTGTVTLLSWMTSTGKWLMESFSYINVDTTTFHRVVWKIKILKVTTRTSSA